MQFADGQLFGRASRLCLREVSAHAFSDCGEHVDPRLSLALWRFRDQLSRGQPRQLTRVFGDPWYIFTDACFEKERDVRLGGDTV